MADIIYTYSGKAYANITNKCNCRCRFCIRFQQDGLGSADALWHKEEPTLEQIKKAIDAYGFKASQELTFCGYGEPTCALDNLLSSAAYAKEKYGLTIRLNTNGLGSLQNGINIVPRLSKVIDTVSISLNAPDKASYDDITQPQLTGAYDAMLSFAECCRQNSIDVRFTVVDVIPQEQLEASQEVADSLQIPLRVRHFSRKQ